MNNDVIKKRAIEYLKKKNFHQLLRSEILFQLTPKTMAPGPSQKYVLQELCDVLIGSGFLRGQGFRELGTVKKLESILEEELTLQYSGFVNIQSFLQSSKPVNNRHTC